MLLRKSFIKAQFSYRQHRFFIARS